MAVATCIGTIIWPIGRWAMQKDGQSALLGFWISITAATISATLLVVMGKAILIADVWLAGAALGFAYSVGFCILVIGCLKFGPMSLSMTLNNMAMLFGVLYSIAWLRPMVPNHWIVIGIGGVCVALILLGLGTRQNGQSVVGINRKWLMMILPGSALSGLSFISQTYVGTIQPAHSLLFLCSGFTVSLLILAPIVFFGNGFEYRSRERIAGVLMGIGMVLNVPFVMWAIQAVGAALVLPVTVASPIILILIISHFVYRERLPPVEMAACLFGTLSVALLSYGSSVQ